MKYSYFKFEVYTSTTVFNPTEIHLYESGVEFFPSSISGVSYSARSVGTYGPQLAFDGNSSTSYMSAAELNPHWIAVNLNGTTKNLTEFRLENRTDTHLPYILNVYVSLDGISWNLYGGINFENWVASSSTLTRHITTFKDTLSNVLFLQLSGNPGDTLFRSSDYNYRLIANAGGGTYISTSNPPTNYTNSTYFNGVVNNYLIVNKTTDLKWWLSSPINFTIEAFVYPTDLNTWGNTIIPFFISQGNGIVSTPDWAFGPLSNGKIAFYYNNGSSVYVYSTATISINQWSHIAVSITATTIYILVNGVIYSTAKLATTIADAYSLIIIGQGVNTEIKGYVSSIRISNTAFYTTNTTVPIAPFYYNTALTPLVLSSDTSYKKQIAVPTDGIPPIKVLSNDNNIINQIQTPLLTPRIQLINNSPVSPFIGINFYIIDTVLGTKSSILAIPYFNYTFTIKGTVTINGVPASRKVRLYYQNDNSIVAENVSDATTGYYEFDNLNIEDYYISALDYNEYYDPVSYNITSSQLNLSSDLSFTQNFDFLNLIDLLYPYNLSSINPSDPRLVLFTGTALENNGSVVQTVTLLTYPDGQFITSTTPAPITGSYSFYLQKGYKYIMVFIGDSQYRPESYFYQPPA